MEESKIKLCKDIAELYKKDLNLVLKNTDKPLLTAPFHLTTEELLYLYFQLKKNYDLPNIGGQAIEGAFESIDRIYSILI